MRFYPIVAGVIASLVLGWIGIDPSLVSRTNVDWFDHLYYTLLLFKFSAPSSGPINTELAIAIWLAPLTTLYAAFRAAATVYFEQWTRFRVTRFSRGHVVVLGLGRVGARLAVTFAEAGFNVLAVDPDAAGEKREVCREHGIAFIGGNAEDPGVLAQAALDRASILIVTCGSDALNAQVALTGLELAGRGRGRLCCYVHIDEEQLCAMLEEAAFEDARAAPFVLDFFNIYRLGPRALLDVYGPSGDETDSPRHVVVVGAGRVAGSVLIEVARREAIDPHPKSPLRITLVSPTASAMLVELKTKYPELDGTCSSGSCDVDASNPLNEGELSIEVADANSTVVLVCENDDTAGVRSTMQIREIVDPDVLIVLCSSSSADSSALQRLAGSQALSNVVGFALLDRVCRPEVLLNGERELIARSIHDAYVRGEIARGRRVAPALNAGGPANEVEARSSNDGPDASLVPWDSLPESLRASNRSQADDIGHKLHLVGRRIVSTTSWRPPAGVFTEDEVEKLAQLEHERWMDERLEAGWRYGPVRDPIGKIHPSIVPWDDLDDDDKDRDREPVRAIPLILARAGFAVAPIVRRVAPTTSATAAEPPPLDVTPPPDEPASC